MIGKFSLKAVCPFVDAEGEFVLRETACDRIHEVLSAKPFVAVLRPFIP